MGKDTRRIINKSGGDANSATIEANTWRFYDENKVFLWQFVFSDDRMLIPLGLRPQACSQYYVCHDGSTCQCPSGLARYNCKPQVETSCDKSKDSSSLVNAGENLSYFALGFVLPSSKTDLDGCKSSCLNNCTCLAMFFDNDSGNCYMFDQIGSFEDAKKQCEYRIIH
ncbi:putative non-specific serine/threonine protein kinase [Helianthus annuus]|nr:putative non-specific serine/threonine protein kinase [Helianthus annuus]